MKNMQNLKDKQQRAASLLRDSVKLYTENERIAIKIKQEQMLINSEINALRHKLEDLADELIELDDIKVNKIIGKIEMAARETYDAGEDIKEALMELEVDATSSLVSEGYRRIKDAASVLGITDLDLLQGNIANRIKSK